MILPLEALEKIKENANQLSSELLDLPLTVNCIIAEDIKAPHAKPTFARSMMDGFAVKLSDAGKKIRVTNLIPAGTFSDKILVETECAEIMTGAPCPIGSEAVVPIEDVVRINIDEIQLPSEIILNQYIAESGSECAINSLITSKYANITPLLIGAIAAFGIKQVKVIRKPRVAIIISGTEVIPYNNSTASNITSDQNTSITTNPASIFDASGPMLVASILKDLGYLPELNYITDSLDNYIALFDSLNTSDILIFTGGVSVGKFDFLPEVIKKLGGSIIFHEIAQKPGKPLLFAKIKNQYVFGLPGNPLATHFCYNIYVKYLINLLQNNCASVESYSGIIEENIQNNSDRTWFIPATYNWKKNEYLLNFLLPRNSADIYSSSCANCYVEIQANSEFKAGEIVKFYKLN